MHICYHIQNMRHCFLYFTSPIHRERLQRHLDAVIGRLVRDPHIDERRRCAVALRTAATGRRVRTQLVGKAEDRIEARKGMIAVEIGAGAKLIRHLDHGDIQAPADCQ